MGCWHTISPKIDLGSPLCMIGPHLLFPPLITFFHNHSFLVIKDIANACLSSASFSHWKDASELEILELLITEWKSYITNPKLCGIVLST